MKRIEYDFQNVSADFIRLVKHELTNDGVLVIGKFKNEDNSTALINLANAIGKLTTVGINVPDNELERSLIHNIDSRRNPIKDKYGFVIQSTTSNEFLCHTDDYFSEEPVDVLLFHCIIQSKHGGMTKICYIDDVVNSLPTWILDELTQSQFPVHFGKVPIVRFENGSYSVRYNRLELERAVQITGESLTDYQKEILDCFDSHILKNELVFKLKKYDCIVINNKTVLHGRTSFPIGSKRLLKRLRLHYA